MELNTTYFKKLHEIGKVLETGRSMIDEQYIDSFNLELKQVEDGWQDVVDTNRTLKIGIVGGVKAGKSSFLNALLFRGRDILPKAATPMTAALTKISYSETPYAKIVFYEDKDWNAILQNAATFDERLETAIANEKSEELKNKRVYILESYRITWPQWGILWISIRLSGLKRILMRNSVHAKNWQKWRIHAVLL